MSETILTKRLNRFGGNRLVLAKHYGYGNGDGIMAVTYANRTGAQKKADQLKAQGIECYVTGDHPFYVTFNNDPNEQTKAPEKINRVFLAIDEE